ncbi:alcohol dehydrogenase catalytic domain-containing protein [Kineosporia sp. J2-2]|uniref:Alcohol dehydrogenase catalytic domain-containing protein n=1 Tax=Kineosporia corallincola TaxID=2835133 RepID=A0ABS5TCN3_9ACTN|nr:alcohol dehydrogenase catalytic domain-containing protein [Kineosporia corallincola]MBT0768801.1 alcohol dehydrogenase catalytic domain-containing protein [Kineosporia corallincola]
MRAFVITAPGRGEVREVPEPQAGPGQVVVAVERAGVCGTDAEFFSGRMSYLASGHAAYPLRIGHEWCGRVAAVGAGVDDAWLGRRVSGDTMLGCGACRLCRTGRQHLCVDRFEIGIRGGWPGALAERLPVPVTALVPLPEQVGPVAGAMIEPAANALRAVRGADLRPGARLLVVGPGTIGLLAAQIARSTGVEVHVAGPDAGSLRFAASLGFGHRWTTREAVPTEGFDAVLDASNGRTVPGWAVDLVDPGGRVVLIGLSGEPSTLDSRAVVLKDVTVVGVLSGSGGLHGAADLFASGAVDPSPLVATTVGLDGVAAVLAGQRPPASGPSGAGPKIHVDPAL